MSAESRFMDDMRPRIFLNERKQLLSAKVPVTKPVLSDVSMFVNKNQPTKLPVRKSFAMMGSASPEDTMLEQINKIIENSPPMIYYQPKKNNGSKSISPRQTNINISSQTLTYKASTRDNLSINEPKMSERSFALPLLDMKYRSKTLTTPDNRYIRPRGPPLNAIEEEAKSSPPNATGNEFLPDQTDYLIRHGLLKE